MGFRAMLSCLVGTHCLCYKKATEIKQVVVVVAQAQNHLGPCIRTAAFEDVVFQYQNHAEQAKKIVALSLDLASVHFCLRSFDL